MKKLSKVKPKSDVGLEKLSRKCREVLIQINMTTASEVDLLLFLRGLKEYVSQSGIGSSVDARMTVLGVQSTDV